MQKSPRSAQLNQDAAVYVRMSTEHQQYSTANQMDVIVEFAKSRGLNITEMYSDEGKSGLDIHGREGLGRLIANVQNGEVKFRHILVYDVSRWGRFQDADESAYYEYVCRRAGISVYYCAEQFDNDGSLLSTIIKSIKRAMAGEFSRELSTKTFQGACRLVQLGFRQGGIPGFGYRRMLVNEKGERKGILQNGERKCIHTDHVILVPGPIAEVKTVRWIFRQFVEKGRTEAEIATTLNAKGILNHGGRVWSGIVIRDLLKSEKYIGHNVYHRTSYKLRKKHFTNPPEMWIRADGAFEGIVPKKLFEAARKIFLGRSERMTNEVMLKHLHGVLARHGQITGVLIGEFGEKPSRSAIRRRFGSLSAAYSLIGYRPPRDYSYKVILRKRRSLYREVVADIRKHMEPLGSVVREDEISRLLIINDEVKLSIMICRPYTTDAGAARWVISLDRDVHIDLIVAARMHRSGDSIRDYYILPACEIGRERVWLAEENGVDWDGYRFETLEYLYSLCEQVTLETPHEETA